MRTFIEWLLDYRSRSPQGTPVSDLRDDTKRMVAAGYCRDKGSYSQLRAALTKAGASDMVFKAASAANKLYGAYTRAQQKGLK